MNRERMCSLPKQRELNRGDNIAVVQQSKFTDVCHPDGRKDPAQGLMIFIYFGCTRIEIVNKFTFRSLARILARGICEMFHFVQHDK